jgi:pyruvate dehydrogenase E2 component (dihydrolipoamide acetyltransferase)
MATEVVIPKLGMTMKEATIVEWLVPDGGRVEEEQVLFELATDKLDTEATSPAAGILCRAAPEGETLPVGTVVAWILTPDEAPPGPPIDRPPSPQQRQARQPAVAAGLKSADRVVASPYARRLARDRGVDLRGRRGSGPSGRIVAADLPPPSASPSAAGASLNAAPPSAGATLGPSNATPVARALAQRLGLDVALMAGTGPGGRITKEDVETAFAGVADTAPPSGAGAVDGRDAIAPERAARSRQAPVGHIPFRGMRRVIAERMQASLREMAQVTLGMEVDVTDAAAVRDQLRDEWEPDGVRLSYTDLVCRAAVKALGSHPALNASVESDAIVLHDGVDLGIAVAVPDGLLVPVVPRADQRSLKELSAEAARLAEACRDGTVGLDDLAGASFTVTALGASGIDFFTPVINPPNVAILGVGRVHDGVAWQLERPVRRQLMTLSLTIDHRAVDGAPGAAFLLTVRELLEHPYRLLV